MLKRVTVSLAIIVALASAQQQSPTVEHQVGQFRISGTVVSSSTQEPLAHSTVHIASTIDPSYVREYITGDDGKFVFENLAAGKYSLTASHRGYREQGYDQHSNFWTAIVVGPNLKSDNLLFRLKPDAGIWGKVTDEGDPLANGQALLFHHSVDEGLASTHFVESSSIDDQGIFHFRHLLAGTYFVAVQAEPWYAQHSLTPPPPPPTENGNAPMFSRPSPPPSDPKLDLVYPITFYDGGTDLPSATAITLNPGDRYEADISLQAVPAARLRVHMKTDDPSHFPQITISDPQLAGAPVLFSNGMQRIGDYLEIVGLSPGHKVLTIQNKGLTRKQEVDVAGTTDVNLSDSTRSGSVTGTVSFQGASGVPPDFSLVLNDRRSGSNAHADVAKDGSFSVDTPLPPGNYEVILLNSPGYAVERITAVGARVLGQTVLVKNSGPIRLSIALSRQFGEAQGFAYLGDKGYAGAMIVLVPSDSGHNVALFRRDQSDSDGSFRLPAILPGKYTVVAIRDGWDLDLSNPAVISAYLPGGQPLEVAANGKYDLKVNVQEKR